MPSPASHRIPDVQGFPCFIFFVSNNVATNGPPMAPANANRVFWEIFLIVVDINALSTNNARLGVLLPKNSVQKYTRILFLQTGCFCVPEKNYGFEFSLSHFHVPLHHKKE